MSSALEPTEAETSDAAAVEAPLKSGVGPGAGVVEVLQPASAIANEQLSTVHIAGPCCISFSFTEQILLSFNIYP